jgi:hypothetical protein
LIATMRRPDNSAADRRREVGLLRLKAQIGQLGVDAVALDQASESVAAFAVAIVADQPDDLAGQVDGRKPVTAHEAGHTGAPVDRYRRERRRATPLL